MAIFEMELKHLTDETEVNQSIGARVRQAREARGWSIDRLAQETRLSRNGLWRMETDPERVPYTRTLQKLARALGVPFEYLRTGLGPESPETWSIEAFLRFKGLSNPDHIRLVRDQAEALLALEARMEEEDEELEEE